MAEVQAPTPMYPGQGQQQGDPMQNSLLKAMSHLNKQTERGEHAPNIGGSDSALPVPGADEQADT